MSNSTDFVKPDALGCHSFEGEILSTYASEEGKAWLKSLKETLADAADDQLIFSMRNKVYRLPCPLGGTDLCIKSFKQPGPVRSRLYRRYGSKAQRAHQYARHLFQTGNLVAEPIGFIEQWNGSQQQHSYLISRYLENSSDFYTEMNELLRNRPYAGAFIELCRTVAQAVRTMHDNGFAHQDLGPQNILLQRTGKAQWGHVSVIDLNRGKLLGRALSLKERAKDLDRMKIPSHFRTIFYHIYFNDGDIPTEFQTQVDKAFKRFYWHQKTRPWRHPVRTLLKATRNATEHPKKVTTGLPALRDMWLWDEYSGQPSVVLTGFERRNERATADIWRTLWACLIQAPAIVKRYKHLKTQQYLQPRSLNLRLGVSVEVDTDFAKQRELLQSLAPQSLLVRCYFHLGSDHQKHCVRALSELKADGHSVSLALIQSRQAINHPDQWALFVSEMLAKTHQLLDFVEIGHAINRVKWGLWNLSEMGRLWEHAELWKTQYPDLTFLGPAVNDFEFQYYPPLLNRFGKAFDALSGHLYVDRRGAPENEQSGFNTLDKCTLANAIARNFQKAGYYITEVNWPLEDTGLHSPLAGAYIKNGAQQSALHVSESTSASYMIRYALIALCSGMTERIWWWRLSHPGFGLIDNGSGWRPRPGWHAYAQFQRRISEGEFLSYRLKDGVHEYQFSGFTVVYSESSSTMTLPEDIVKIEDVTGTELPLQNPLTVDDSPLYLIGSGN